MLTIDILDVGQGDGIFIEFPNGKTMLVDLGSTKNKALTQQDAILYFQGHSKFQSPNQVLDYLVLTHGDRDHYNMVQYFVETFQVDVRTVIHGGDYAEYGTLLTDLSTYARETFDRALDVVAPAPPYPFQLGPDADSETEFGAEVWILSSGLPAPGDLGYRKNSRSVVLSIGYGDNWFMLTGDATRHTEKYVVGLHAVTDQIAALQSDVLKIAHHGSRRTSSSVAWIKTVDPVFAFVSADRSGALDPAQRPTGHRLPQLLTLSLHQQYALRLASDCELHSVVASFDPNDYAEYAAHPDVPQVPTPVPAGFGADRSWVQAEIQNGLFTTLATMGVGADDPDQGVQYRIAGSPDGSLTVFSTHDFDELAPAGVVGPH